MKSNYYAGEKFLADPEFKERFKKKEYKATLHE
jgi:hypothetical protein